MHTGKVTSGSNMESNLGGREGWLAPAPVLQALRRLKQEANEPHRNRAMIASSHDLNIFHKLLQYSICYYFINSNVKRMSISNLNSEILSQKRKEEKKQRKREKKKTREFAERMALLYDACYSRTRL